MKRIFDKVDHGRLGYMTVAWQLIFNSDQLIAANDVRLWLTDVDGCRHYTQRVGSMQVAALEQLVGEASSASQPWTHVARTKHQ